MSWNADAFKLYYVEQGGSPDSAQSYATNLRRIDRLSGGMDEMIAERGAMGFEGWIASQPANAFAPARASDCKSAARKYISFISLPGGENRTPSSAIVQTAGLSCNKNASALPDGLDELRSAISLDEIMRLIASTARWVATETFEYLPLWYPEYGRTLPFYKADWMTPQLNKGEQKTEGNTYANRALTSALGLRSRDRPNWSCCHIWGVDDATFATENHIVRDRRFYSCVANLVLLPTPLKAFTDSMFEVKAMLRACAANTYGWVCDHQHATAQDHAKWAADPAYPALWPKKIGDPPPPGTMPFNERIRLLADRRKAAIEKGLALSNTKFPAEAVEEAQAYWRAWAVNPSIE